MRVLLTLAAESRGFFLWYLGATLAGFAQPNGDSLFATLHFAAFAAGTALGASALEFVHLLLNGLRSGRTVFAAGG